MLGGCIFLGSSRRKRQHIEEVVITVVLALVDHRRWVALYQGIKCISKRDSAYR
jgi:hypothetical protein